MKNTKKILLSLALLLLAGGTAFAQQKGDDVIFGALRQELERGMEGLRLPGYTTPHYMSYILKDTEFASVTASLGTIVSDRYVPSDRYVGAAVYTGDYQLNNDAGYQPMYAFSRTVADNDPAQIRRDLWAISDALYKNAASMYQNKLASLKRQNITDPLPDMIRTQAVKVIDDAPALNADRERMRTMAKELSSMFLDYPDLYGTMVMLSAMQHTTYIANSEGSLIKQPVTVYVLSAAAGIDTPEGTEVGNQLVEYYPAADGFPATSELRKKIEKFAAQTLEIKTAPVADEYYYGPVMYEGQAAMVTFTSNLLSPKTLLAYRKPVDDQAATTTLANRVGRKVIDTRLTVKNLTDLEEYNGKKLFGAYGVDLEGVVPADGVTLIDKGLFRHTLSSRIPTDISSESTGSLRFGISVGKGSIGVYPGVLQITATETESPEELKKQLIERAAEEGNDCAYIVRSVGSANPRLYRVDLATGDEKLVRNANVPVPALDKLYRLAGISDQEQVVNEQINNSVPFTIICPKAILVNDIEITPKEVKSEKLFFTKNPLQRK